jgi:hypothetical protein
VALKTFRPWPTTRVKAMVHDRAPVLGLARASFKFALSRSQTSSSVA